LLRPVSVNCYTVILRPGDDGALLKDVRLLEQSPTPR
jgi:hypothetical protein